MSFPIVIENNRVLRDTPDHSRRVWKAYHERQALAAGLRQYSRPVYVDHMLWGDLLTGKLLELIEGDRHHPRSIVKGGAADRNGDHCMLPELDDIRLHSGHDHALAAAVGKPKVLRFSDEGLEYTVDSIGAQGEFDEMYRRRYDGFDARSRESGGLAAERAWSRAGHSRNSPRETHRERRSRERASHEARSIPWDLGETEASTDPSTGRDFGGGGGGGGGRGGRGEAGSEGDGGGVGGTFAERVASEAATVLSAAAAAEEAGDQGSGLEVHPKPSAGPRDHRQKLRRVGLAEKLAQGGECTGGSDDSVAAHLEGRLVPVGGNTRKLRGTAAREREEQATIVFKDRYVEEAVRRSRLLLGGGDGSGEDDQVTSSTIPCSVSAIEDIHIKTLLANDALSAVKEMVDINTPEVVSPAKHRGAAAVGFRSPAAIAMLSGGGIQRGPRGAHRVSDRRAEKTAKLGRNRADRSAPSPHGGGGVGIPRGSLLPRNTEVGGRGVEFDCGNEEISVAPSMSSLGAYSEGIKGRAPPQGPVVARKAGGRGGMSPSGGGLPAVLVLPPAANPLGEEDQGGRIQSRRPVPPAPPDNAKAATTTPGIPGPSSCSSLRTDAVPATSFEAMHPAAEVGSVVAGLPGLASAPGVGHEGAQVRPFDSATAITAVQAVGATRVGGSDISSCAPPSSSTPNSGTVTSATFTTAALLKEKMKRWRSKSSHRHPSHPAAAKDGGISQGARSTSGSSGLSGSSVPGFPRLRAAAVVAFLLPSGGGGGAGGRHKHGESTNVSTAQVHGRAAGGGPAHQLPTVEKGVLNDDRTLAGSVTSSLTPLVGSSEGYSTSMASLAETESSAARSSAQRTLGSGALVGGHPVPGSTATVSATMESALVSRGVSGAERGGMGAGAAYIHAGGRGDGGRGGGSGGGGSDAGEVVRRWQHAAGHRTKPRKKRRSARVHKIKLGSKKQLKSMKVAERTALFIGACEWGDIEALKRLLEIGASPLDPYSPSVQESRRVFSQFFLFLLQVGAGLRPRLAADDEIHTRVLSMLIDAGVKKDPRFLSSARLRDQDEDRGFCLVHHAAAFGNASKVEFLLERGVDPDVRATGGDKTALIVAASSGQKSHLKVAAALIRAGAVVDARDRKGMTALHHAADVGRKHMCHFLLLIGADKTAQDDEGKTPMDLCKTKHPRVFSVLKTFVAWIPPPSTVLDFMEKVEVRHLSESAAKELVLYERAKREREAALALVTSTAPTASGDGGNSVGSWDPASLGGVGADGANLASLGILDSTDTAADSRGIRRRKRQQHEFAGPGVFKRKERR